MVQFLRRFACVSQLGDGFRRAVSAVDGRDSSTATRPERLALARSQPTPFARLLRGQMRHRRLSHPENLARRTTERASAALTKQCPQEHVIPVPGNRHQISSLTGAAGWLATRSTN